MDISETDLRFRSYRIYPSRRKWICILGILISLTLISVLGFYLNIPLMDSTPKNMNDGYSYEIYQNVLENFYNFSDDTRNKWYNRENVSQWNNELVHEVRDNWIIEKLRYPNYNYSLESPEVKDPSMGQAEVIRKIFNYSRNGFFIECGAYDGETRSNTLNLERYYDWTGILIEADPINYSKMLQKNRKAYISPTCLSITPYPKIASFLMANNIGRLHESSNSTDVKYENSADVAHSGKHINVQCFPIATYIFALNRTNVDYFSLDIEGNEIDVLETIPFDLVDIKTLSVEHVHNEKGKQYMIDLMEKNGYYVHSYVERDDNLANDIIFVKENFIPSKKDSF